MGFVDKVKLLFHKITHWEYWPIWIIYFPCFIVYPYYAFKCRSSFFFTVANPGIQYSGAFLTSKMKIYDLLEQELFPVTLLIDKKTKLSHCSKFINEHSLSFPIIVKPDLGLRGLGIHVLRSEYQLKQLLENIEQPYLLQEFVKYKNEIGVFLIRQADGNLRISSIVGREFISVIGDGVKTIDEMIKKIPRYKMQYDWLKEHTKIDFNKVLQPGESMEFDKIGNHSKGATFINGNYMISEKLTATMNKVVASINGFNYGRLDIKFKSYQDLLNGVHFKVIELNGVFSEPAHIYDPSSSLLQAWKDIIKHFSSLYNLSIESIKKGNKPLDFKTGVQKILMHFKMVSNMKK